MITPTKPTDRIFVALDTTDVDHALDLAGRLKGRVGGMKIGKEFFTANGPAPVQKLVESGMPVFLDLKFHDIPNTVAGAVRAAVATGATIVNVHAGGGRDMMEAAAEAASSQADALGMPKPWVIAVTVLTSMGHMDLEDVGVSDTVDLQVRRLAELTERCGLDGVVCSAREIKLVRDACGADFKLITPGIRPSWAVAGDQKRILTPKDAVAAGSDVLVIGRPITQADDPVAAAEKIAEELA